MKLQHHFPSYRIYDLNHFKRWFKSVEDIATII